MFSFRSEAGVRLDCSQQEISHTSSEETERSVGFFIERYAIFWIRLRGQEGQFYQPSASGIQDVTGLFA